MKKRIFVNGDKVKLVSENGFYSGHVPPKSTGEVIKFIATELFGDMYHVKFEEVVISLPWWYIEKIK